MYIYIFIIYMWYFNGNAYDLTEFAEKHPGGQHLINETKEHILQIFDFLNKITHNKLFPNKIDIKKIIHETSINNLKKEEELFGFKEASKYSRFFRSGRTEQWKDILSLYQIKLIEKELYPMMKQFNYL